MGKNNNKIKEKEKEDESTKPVVESSVCTKCHTIVYWYHDSSKAGALASHLKTAHPDNLAVAMEPYFYDYESKSDIVTTEKAEVDEPV